MNDDQCRAIIAAQLFAVGRAELFRAGVPSVEECHDYARRILPVRPASSAAEPRVRARDEPTPEAATGGESEARALANRWLNDWAEGRTPKETGEYVVSELLAALRGSQGVRGYKPAWHMECPACGHESLRYRRPEADAGCDCNDPDRDSWIIVELGPVGSPGSGEPVAWRLTRGLAETRYVDDEYGALSEKPLQFWRDEGLTVTPLIPATSRTAVEPEDRRHEYGCECYECRNNMNEGRPLHEFQQVPPQAPETGGEEE